MSLNLKSYFDDKLTFFFQEGEGGGGRRKICISFKNHYLANFSRIS